MSVNTNNENNFITLSSFPRAIAHIDCDAFFTSCEEARNPTLKGKPLVTGKERGIVSCPSYSAKKLGIKRAMRLFEACKICPDLIILPSDYELYSIYSQRLFNIIRRFTSEVEEYSIDEAFCDLTGLRRVYRSSYEDIAFKIKTSIQKELGITVSVGLSLSKTLAKICSKENKPDGFTALPGYKLHEILKNIPLERVCGFGPNTVALLNKYGVNNVLDYVKKEEGFCKKLLGKIGIELWNELRGVSVYNIVVEKKDKYLSISKSKTFVPASNDKDFVKAQLMRNMESAFIKLRRYKLSAKILTVFLKKNDFTMIGAEAKLNRHSSATLAFTESSSFLFNKIFEKGILYRATGVVLNDIVEEGVDDRTLFDDPIKIERMRKISEVADTINSMYGKHTIHIASTCAASKKSEHPRNNVSWRKEDLLKGETFRKRLGIPLLKIN